MAAITNFMTKAAEFYLSAPAFFNWAAPLLVVGIGGLVGLAYWLGGKLAEAENNGLKAQIAALDQRFNFAKEQAALSTKEAVDLKAQLEKLKSQIAGRASLLELQNSTAVLDGNLNRLMIANTAVADALDYHYRSFGFDGNGQLIWRKIAGPAP